MSAVLGQGATPSSRARHPSGRLLAALALLACIPFAPSAEAASTQYPLTLHNCGRDITIPRAPERVVSIGQSNTEILFALGLADRMVGTALWLEPPPAEYAAANARIPRLADNDPSFEAVVGRDPDLVTVQFEWHVGPRGTVGTRDQFATLGVPTYISPTDCVAKDNSAGGDGVRRQMFTSELIYREIQDYAAMFDVADRGAALVARLRQREADAVASVSGSGGAGSRGKDIPVLFWFSSREVTGDAFVAGKNGAPAYILSKLGDRNVVTVDDEWPTVGWESLVAANPAVIVIARMDRRRFPADDVDVKLHFLQTDPVVSQLEAVRKRRFVVMDAQSMNPTLRTLDGVEVLAEGIRSFGLAE